MQIVINKSGNTARTHREVDTTLADQILRRNGYRRVTVWRTDITNTLLFVHIEPETHTME